METKETTFTLVREYNSEVCCMGTLTLPSGRRLKTLEPCYRGQLQGRQEKVKGKTAIPYGRYEMKAYLSPKFHQYLPLLQKVPQFEGVEIHVGNFPWNTTGCILVGLRRTITLHDDSSFVEGTLQNSQLAMNYVRAEFEAALEQGQVFIDISLAKGVKAFSKV